MYHAITFFQPTPASVVVQFELAFNRGFQPVPNGPFKLDLLPYFQISVIGAASRSPSASGSNPKLSSIVRSTL
jgi:hypothetical protein